MSRGFPLAILVERVRPAIAFAHIQPFLARGGKKGHGHEIRGALALHQSSVWLRGTSGIQRRNCGANPRCACGSIIKKGYSTPVFRYLDFLKVREPALVHQDPAKD
ncbi:MAG TPA: hypothetical protein VJO16_21575 [Candidatus Acidoferrum sp.]|nr:hypothetical protein [Candidatus Acidoferrum sp.]